MCDRVIVMYGGKVQEEATSQEIFSAPLHPYTSGLMKSLPNPYSKSEKKLYSIKGNVPALVDMPAGCKFRTRCDKASEKCKIEPPLKEVSNGHYVRCWLY